jgi:hypothetical protein
VKSSSCSLESNVCTITITAGNTISNNNINAPGTSSFCTSGNPSSISGSSPFGGGSGSRIVFNVDTTGGNSSFPAVALAANAWVHYVGTYNGSTIALYKDGVFVQSSAFGGGVSTGMNELNIGNNRASPSDGYFNGNLDDITIYNTALTANEAREIYRLGRGYGVFPEPDSDEGFVAAFNRRRRVLLTAG